ncbi:unnamed protein product [Lactuca virosa]|uniref:Uncharacterized protein n=1 Tax=Lactuca virosa TaxID=75947 RepID=A0AAU9M050_9ASTR|nr:unnamed protein product [Lactuca virosa]
MRLHYNISGGCTTDDLWWIWWFGRSNGEHLWHEAQQVSLTILLLAVMFKLSILLRLKEKALVFPLGMDKILLRYFICSVTLEVLKDGWMGEHHLSLEVEVEGAILEAKLLKVKEGRNEQEKKVIEKSLGKFVNERKDTLLRDKGLPLEANVYSCWKNSQRHNNIFVEAKWRKCFL